MKGRSKPAQFEQMDSDEIKAEHIHYSENEKVRNRSRQHKEQDQDAMEESTEVDKYEK